jgi:hypothetical protein
MMTKVPTFCLWAFLVLLPESLGFLNTPASSRVLSPLPRVQAPKSRVLVPDGPYLKYLPKIDADDEALVKRQSTADASSDGEKKGFGNKVGVHALCIILCQCWYIG